VYWSATVGGQERRLGGGMTRNIGGDSTGKGSVTENIYISWQLKQAESKPKFSMKI